MQIPIRYGDPQAPHPQKEGREMHDNHPRNDEDIIYAPFVDETPSAVEPPADLFAANPRRVPQEHVASSADESSDNNAADDHADVFVDADGEIYDRCGSDTTPESVDAVADADIEMDVDPCAEETDEDAVETVLKEDYDLLQQRYDRLMADWDNYRRRSAEEIANAKEAANRNIVEAMIPTVDNFTLALDHVKSANLDPAAAEMLRGFEAIQRSLLSQLAREGMEVIAPEIGSPFDMMQHQAVDRREGTDLAPDSVAAVIQPGYKFKGSVIRPAMISVAV